MLGEYSKFIQIQDDGTVKVFVPEDVNNPSMKNATELTLSNGFSNPTQTIRSM